MKKVQFFIFFLCYFLNIKGSFCSVSFYTNLDNDAHELNDMLFPEEFPVAYRLFPFSFNQKYYYIKPYILNHKVFPKVPEKPFYVTYEEFLRHELKYDWDIKRKTINIDQMNMAVVSAIGGLAPKLNFTITTNPYTPLDVSHMFKGLFGFLVPANWFKLFSAMQMSKAEKYSYMDLLLNKYLLAQLGYIATHRAKWDFIIYEVYANSVKNFINILKNDGRYQDKIYLKFLESYFFDLQAMVAIKIGDLNERLPALAKLGNYADMKEINNFQIRPIPFPRMDGIPDISPYPYEEKAFENSFTLDVIEKTRRALNAKMGATFLGGIGVTDEKNIGVVFGLDTIANGLIIRDDVRKLYVNYDEVKADIAASIVVAAKNYNRALIGYRALKESLWYQQQALQEILVNYELTHYVHGKLHRVLNQILNNLYVMNACYHMMLVSAVTLERYLVSPALLKVKEIYPEGSFKEF